MYYRARFYDTETGRFLTKDPLTGGPDDPSICYKTNIYAFFDRAITENINSLDPHNTNRYIYCRNNPINFTDPTGMVIETVWDVGSVIWDTGWLVGRAIETAVHKIAGNKAKAEKAWSHTKVKAVDVGVDVGAVLIPFVPAGISKLKYADEAVDAVKHGKRLLSKGDEAAKGIAKGKKLLNKADDVAEKGRTVLGKMDDLKKPGALKKGEKLLDLPDMGSPKANWKQNASKLRKAMRKGKPIRDASVTSKGSLRSNTGFLRAERNLLESKGWKYNKRIRSWKPPRKKLK